MQHNKQLQHFATLLTQYVDRDGRRARQLSQGTAVQFGQVQQVHHNTISRWLRGETRHPRSWTDIVKLASILRLTEQETNELLMSAGHAPLTNLRTEAIEDTSLFAYWERKPPALPSNIPFQIPPELATFVGRTAECRILTEKLRSCTSCCIQGMGGVGKTTLAIHLAYKLKDFFTDGVLWASLDSTDAMSVLQSFAAAYGANVSHYPDIDSRSSQVRALLAHKRVLIVLDGAVTDEAIRPLLPPTGTCAVLITTRHQDLAVADQAYRLTLTPPSKKDSLSLFAKVLGQGRVHREREDLIAIADLLGHLPLAVSIAANRLKHEVGWSAANFWQRLNQQQQRLDLLARGDQQVRLSLAVSYQALTSEEQQLFAALGVLADADFSIEAVVAILDLSAVTIADKLRHLQKLSLVQAEANGRYRLHPLLRDYSREQPCLPVCVERMVNFFVEYIITNQANYLDLDTELRHLLKALDLALAQDNKEMLVLGINALYPFLQARGLYDLAQHYLEWALKATHLSNDEAELIVTLRHLGTLTCKKGQFCQANEYYQESLALAQQREDTTQLKVLLTQLGVLAYLQGECHHAKQYYEQAMHLARQTNDQHREAILLTNLGLLAADAGNVIQAISYYEKGLQLARSTGNQRQPIITLLQNLGDLADRRGDYAQARQYLEEGLSLARAMGDPELESRLLGNLGLVAFALGNYRQAARCFRKGLALAQRSGLCLQMSRQYAYLGRVETAQGDYDTAHVHYEEALLLARQNNVPAVICRVLNLQGECYLKQAKLQAAKEAFTEAQRLAEISNQQLEIGKSWYGLSRITALLGNMEVAHQQGRTGAEILMALGHKRAEEVICWLEELPPTQVR